MSHLSKIRYLLIFFSLVMPTCLLLKIKARSSTDNAITTSIDEQPAVIFDLGGVLLDVQRLSMINQLGWFSLGTYFVTAGSPKRGLYKLLNDVQPTKSYIAIQDDEGYEVPSLMVDWFINTKTGKEIEALVNEYLTQHKKNFSCVERKLLQRFTHALFDPVAFSNHCTVSKEAIKLVKKCKKRGFRVCILSNLDAQTFLLIKRNNPELFNLFAESDIFISGNLGLAKPDPAIYQLVLSKINGPAILVDDQLENVRAARKSGMRAIHFRRSSGLSGLFGSTKKDLAHMTIKKIASLQQYYPLQKPAIAMA